MSETKLAIPEETKPEIQSEALQGDVITTDDKNKEGPTAKVMIGAKTVIKGTDVNFDNSKHEEEKRTTRIGNSRILNSAPNVELVGNTSPENNGIEMGG